MKIFKFSFRFAIITFVWMAKANKMAASTTEPITSFLYIFGGKRN